MDPVVIEVHDIPDVLPTDQMVNQLKIHFLRRSNQGGDVLLVIYPTSTVGQAYVIFESSHVPGVLQTEHLLETNGKFFPIQVKNSHLSKVDMLVETELDLKMFPNPQEVLELVSSHGFKLTEVHSSVIQLNGSFIKLKLLRHKLVSLQRESSQSSNGCSSETWSGSSLPAPIKSYGSKLLSSCGVIMSNKEAISHQTSLPVFNDFSTTYQRDFRGVEPKLGLGYDNNKGAYMGSSYTGSLTGIQSRYSSTQHCSMPTVDPSVDSSGSSTSWMELKSSRKNLRDSEGCQNYSESFQIHSHYLPKQHQSSSSSASAFTETQLASRFSNPPSPRQSGSESPNAFQMAPRTSKTASMEPEENQYYSESYRVNHNRHSSTHHQSRSASTSFTDSGSWKHTESSKHKKENQNTDIIKDKDELNKSQRPFVDGSSSVSQVSPSTHESSEEDSFSSSSKSFSMATDFPVDTDTLNYLLTQSPDTISNIGKMYGTKMSLQDNPEFTTVRFMGRRCEDAKRNFQSSMTTLNLKLRTQEIKLRDYSHTHQDQILKRIGQLKEPGVFIKHSNGIVKVVGDSRQSFEIKQKLIGEDPELQRGRSTQKSSRSRRSLSVPRQHKMPNQQRYNPSPEAHTRSTTNHHPVNTGNAPQDPHDLQSSTIRTTTELRKHQSEEIPALVDERRSTSGPKILKTLGADLDTRNFKKSLRK